MKTQSINKGTGRQVSQTVMASHQALALKQQEPRVVNTGIVLFSNPLQYRYKIEETGETFNSTKTNARETLEEHKFLKSVNALTTELDKIDIF